MRILGISCFYHDAAAALIQDGQLVAAAEEERFSRKKHDSDFPRLAIRYCLEVAGLTASDLDYVIFYEKPFVKFERILTTSLQVVPKSWKVFGDAMTTWLLDKLWVKNLIRQEMAIPSSRILFSEHHLSHAASTFLCSPFDEAAILTVDGVGEWATATMGRGKGTEIKLLREVRFPHSVGLLYSAFTAFLGFEVNEGEYKVMGMAPYGSPRYVDKVRKLIHLDADGSFWLNMDYFCFHHSSTQTYNRRFTDLFGEPRDPAWHFFTERSGYPSYFEPKPSNYKELAAKNQYYADIAASIQQVTEEIVLGMVRSLHQETGLDRICMAGGVALNSVANGRIIKETPIREVFIQPAAGDGGGALGAALYAYHCALGQPRQFLMRHAYWGQEFSQGEINDFARTCGMAYETYSREEELLDAVVGELQAGHVVGWFQGRFEWGPRALGSRSIIADPRRHDMKEIVNIKIKFREPFRPFAPSVLAESAERFFDLPDAPRHYPARFMLYVVDVKAGQADVLPAITHVDGTARLQTVHKAESPLYYNLINRFGQATGVPVILNTSFNLKGEPIVTTPANAFSTFARSGMDSLVLGNCLIRKES
ncbi:MAG TPA: carbamoyltransferase N-terminal domain-containing protein [Candidatus Margulisiibacteriota bacterium]|nr:carbamoyltransferase N-terminal domain-containing protein [Candidatus Margulisiibacteriota bacterium]